MSLLVVIFALVIVVLLVIKLYFKLICGHYKITQDLTGKVILITGASSGIGKEAALEFAKHGARVYMPVRNMQRGKDVADHIKEASGSQQVFLLECDFSSMVSVRKCAQAFRHKEKRLDVLINNAGAWGQTGSVPKMTSDNLEITMASNHFGPFVFTNLLLDVLKASAPSRVVTTSSIGHMFAPFDINSPPTFIKGQHYEERHEYECTKFANVLFTRELARRLQGTGVTANCLHPGFVASNLIQPNASPLYKAVISASSFYAKSTVEGCQTILYLAVAPEVESVSGHYFADCKPVAVRLDALDDELAAKFWEISEKLTVGAMKVRRLSVDATE